MKLRGTKLATLVVLVGALSSSPAEASKGIIASVQGMAFMNSTKQGGEGPSGSTILTNAEILYTRKWWGIGMFGQYDKQGANQTDFAFGPKVDLQWKAFFVEFGYIVLLQRSFTDRTIANQSGNGFVFGAGVRVPLKGPIGDKAKGPFLHFSYKYRIQNISSQDGVKLDEGITQTDGYPIFGIGYDF